MDHSESPIILRLKKATTELLLLSFLKYIIFYLQPHTNHLAIRITSFLLVNKANISI